MKRFSSVIVRPRIYCSFPSSSPTAAFAYFPSCPTSRRRRIFIDNNNNRQNNQRREKTVSSSAVRVASTTYSTPVSASTSSIHTASSLRLQLQSLPSLQHTTRKSTSATTTASMDSGDKKERKLSGSPGGSQDLLVEVDEKRGHEKTEEKDEVQIKASRRNDVEVKEQDYGSEGQPATARSENDNDDSDSLRIKDRTTKNNKNNRKKSGKKRERPAWSDEDVRGRKAVHPGSYANPALRALLGVELPQHAKAGVAAAAAAAAGTPAAEVDKHSMNKKEEDGDDDDNDNVDKPKMAKRKVAFMLGYLGKGYGGFQMNEEQRTLQGEFELALLKCKLLSAKNFGYPFKYGWSTSGRTDKGVHACAQVCSCKVLLPEDETLDEVRERINANLPSSEQFQVLDIVRTTRNFCAKTQRDRVRYQYMIPSFALTDVEELRRIFEKAGVGGKVNNIDDKSSRSTMDPLTVEEVTKIRNEFQNVRATQQQLDRLQSALQRYEGTHLFHNFTKGVNPNEGRASRYIVSFHAGKPKIFEGGGMEWIPTQVTGQSFLLHQIRKMVSLAIDVARNAAPLETVDKLLSKETETRLNTAPAQGLFLEMSFYNGYNLRKQANRELRDIDWDCETSQAHARWKEFRENVIMQHIASEEQREANFLKYLYVQEHYFDYRKFYKLEEEKNMAENESQTSGLV